MSADHPLQIPADLAYTREHEWVRVSGTTARVGISDFAQHELGDIVHVELPEVGRVVRAGDPAAVVESVKSVSDVYAPCAGRITAVNAALEGARVNADPYGDGWLFEVAVDQPGTYLTAAEYSAHIGR